MSGAARALADRGRPRCQHRDDPGLSVGGGQQLGEPGLGRETVQPVEQDVDRGPLAAPAEEGNRVAAYFGDGECGLQRPERGVTFTEGVPELCLARQCERPAGWLVDAHGGGRRAEVVRGRPPVTGQVRVQATHQGRLSGQSQLLQGRGQADEGLPVLGQRGQEGALDDDDRL